MAQENQDGGLIRRYLLGQLSEDELQRLEEKMMAENEFFNLVLVTEDEMIEEYVQRELPESDRAEFEASFLSTEEGRQKVLYATALSAYVKDVLQPSEIITPVREERVANESAPETPPTKVRLTEAPVVDEPVVHEPSNRSPVPRPAWWRRPALVPYLAAAAAVIVIGLGYGIWRMTAPTEVNRGLSALAYAYRDQRPIEARISGFDYAPALTTRGGEAKVDKTARNLAESLVLDAVLKHPNAATHHAAGRLYLAEKKFDEAIDQFEEALKTDPNSAQIHSDYGAALLEIARDVQSKGEQGRSLEKFGQSIESLNRALELDPSLLEAWFNRALCHEQMRLYNLAKEDWKAYIEKDATSPWAREARQKLQALEDRTPQALQNNDQLLQGFMCANEASDDEQAWRVICQSRDAKGSLIANKLIDDYLDAALNGRKAAAGEILIVLSAAGNLENRRGKDRFLGDFVDFYEAATTKQLETVARARALVKAGHESFYNPKPDFTKAMAFYREAKDKFSRCGDTCEAMHAGYLIGNCYLQQWNAEAAIPLFEALSHACEVAGYKWLQAQNLVSIANADHFLSDFSAAISNTTRSLDIYESMADSIGSTRILFQLADEYRFVNNLEKALDLHANDLSMAFAYFPQPRQLWRNYFSIARTFDQLGLCGAAIDFQREALHLAQKADISQFICRSHNYLGMTFARCGNYPEARTNIERAIEIGESFPDRRVRMETVANSSLQLGYVYRKSGDFNRAIEAYDQSIKSYEELESSPFSYAARKGKLLCCIEGAECPAIEQELEAVLKLFEQHRSKILEESNRNTFFDTEQDIYDVAIDFEYSKKGNARKAFDYSEMSRARSLRDLITTKARVIDNPQSPDITFEAVSRPLSIDNIQPHIPQETQIVQYAVLKDTLLIWVLSRESFFVSVRSISVDKLNERVRNYLRLVSNTQDDRAGEVLRESGYFYDLLIKPVEGWLDGRKQLCIVPDKFLDYFPFGALVSSATGKYFIEEHCFVLSPSTNMFILCSNNALQKEALKTERLLSIGNPLFDRAVFPDLDNLESADREANTIANDYESTCVLVGASATKKRVISEMEASDVIHLATHALVNPWNPLRSRLLLAREAVHLTGREADGTLQAYEIYGLKLARARLVVLSACQTAADKYYGGEGVISLARPFIAKQIPLVVASLWPVDSGSTADLMIRFHSYRKNGRHPSAEALRSAQLDMLRNQESSFRSPYYWAAFVAIGGYASY